MATIKDVAKLAGVSVATVSNYLNSTKPVSREASTRIAQAIDTLRYTPNLSARSLKSRVYTKVGVILPNLNDSYYVQIFQGLESAFHGSGCSLEPAFSYDIPEVEEDLARNMLKSQVCGLILVTCQPDRGDFYRQTFMETGRPVVLIDRDIRGMGASLIRFDSEELLCAITRQLLQSGMTGLTLMTGPQSFSCEEACLKGFTQACREAGVIPSLISVELNKEDAFRKATGLLRKAPPQAILTTSELTATGVLEAIHVLGYSDSQIRVITLGEEHWNKHTHSLAGFSVERPAIRMGAMAAQALLEQLQQPGPAIRRSVECPVEETLEQLRSRFSPAAAAPAPKDHRPLRVLMLDTPAVHSICRLLKNFEQQSGIPTQVVLSPHSRLYSTVMESHASEEPFDVYMYDLPWLPLLAAGGVLQELSPQLPRIGVDSLLPGCMEHFGRYGAGYYGIPLMYAPQMLYYRKDLFQNSALSARYEKLWGTPLRPPRHFEEFNRVADFFTGQVEEIAYGISVPAAYPECLAPELYMRMKAYGGNVVDSRGRVVLDQPATRRACENLLQALQCAKPDFRTATDVSAVEDFLRGETAMLITYPAFLTDAADLRKNNHIGSIGCTHIPGKRPLLGGWSLGISSRCQRAQEAAAFLNWACTEQMANYFSMLGCYSAAASAYSNDELVNLYPWLPLYKEVYPYTSPMLPRISAGGRVISPNDIDAIICQGFYRVLEEKMPIDIMLSQTQLALESLLGSK